MAVWKKVILSLLALFILFITSLAALMDHLFGDMCADTVISQTASPDGKLKAVIFQINCGATTDFNSHVALMSTSSTLATESESLFGSRSLFAADTNHGKAPTGIGGGPEVRIRWKADRRLEIQYHELARIIRANSSAKGIDIDYSTFR